MKLTPIQKKIVSYLLTSSYFFSLGLIFLDLVIYPGFVNNRLISPYLLIGLMAIFHILVRFYTKIRLSDLFIKINFFISPLLLFFAIICHHLEETRVFYTNYFFSNYGFHYEVLPFFLVPMLIFASIHINKLFLSKNWRTIFFFSMMILILASNVLHRLNPILYDILTIEDGVVEYLTMVGFLLSSVISFLFVKKRFVFQEGIFRKIFVVGVIMMGIAFFFVAGEEISWGQRILGIETPEKIAVKNRQGEINLHNSELLWPFVYIGCALIGLWGMIAWIIAEILKKTLSFSKKWKAWLLLAIPQKHLFLNFAFIFIYVLLRDKYGPWKFKFLEEYSELILVVGIFAHLLSVFFSKTFKENKKIQ